MNLFKKPVGIAAIAYAIFLILYFTQFNSNLSSNHKVWGEFGSYLGGSLSPILGIITIYLTYDIIKTQLKQNRQAEFKHMFQILFPSIDRNKDLIKYQYFGKEKSGIEAIRIINKNIENLYKFLNKDDDEDDKKLKNFKTAFWSVFEDIEGSSSTLMKTLHNILKVIDTICLIDSQNTYSDLVRAQLHSEELKFVLYNGIASDDFESFKNNIEKYSILKDLKENTNIDSFLKRQYEEPAFNENSKFSKPFKKTIIGYEIIINRIN